MRNARITAVSLLLLVCGCTSDEEARIRAAQAYLQGRGDAPEDMSLAILEGKVLPGMFPDEAYHAGGAFVYEVYGAPQGASPPDVIFSQRQRPNPDVAIRMRFRNRTQYGGNEDVPFSVTFLNGRAVAIQTPGEEKRNDILEARREAAYRRSALEALAKSGRVPDGGATADPSQRIQALAEILRSDGRGGPPKPGLVFEGAAMGLADIGGPALPTIIELLGEKEYWSRKGACLALRAAGPEAQVAVPHLRKLLESENRADGPHPGADVENACEALGGMRGAARDAVPDLTRLLKSSRTYIPGAAAKALGEIGPEARSAVPALKDLLQDPAVGDSAREALEKIGASAPATGGQDAPR